MPTNTSWCGVEVQYLFYWAAVVGSFIQHMGGLHSLQKNIPEQSRSTWSHPSLLCIDTEQAEAMSYEKCYMKRRGKWKTGRKGRFQGWEKSFVPDPCSVYEWCALFHILSHILPISHPEFELLIYVIWVKLPIYIYICKCTYFIREEERVIKAPEIHEWLSSHLRSYKTLCCLSKSLKHLRSTKNLFSGTSPDNISSTATIIATFNHQGLPRNGDEGTDLLWRGCRVTATKLNLPALRSWDHFHLNLCSEVPVEHL